MESSLSLISSNLDLIESISDAKEEQSVGVDRVGEEGCLTWTLFIG